MRTHICKISRFALTLIALLVPVLLSAQSTTVSGTVQDAGVQTWNNGTYQFVFVPNPSYPNPGSYTWTGGALSLNISGTLSGTGTYSVSIPSNTAISPQGSQWKATFCPLATSACYNGPPVTIVGGTFTLNATPPAISISLINPTNVTMSAYADAEISSAVLGSNYFNVTTLQQRQCTAVTGTSCTTWASMGGGASPAGNNGDLQMKNGAALAASHINDNGTVLKIGEDQYTCGPNPMIDIRCYGARLGFNGLPFVPGVTATIANGSSSATVTGASTNFFNGDPVVIYGAGPAQSMSTPTAPAVVSSLMSSMLQTGQVVASPAGGSTTNCYRIVAYDQKFGYTAASPETCVTGQPLGLITTAISSCTRNDNTVTCNTSTTHTLSVGAMVILNGTDYEIVATVPNNTSFTFSNVNDARNGAGNPAFTTMNQWNCNAVTLPAFGAGAWEYAVYAGSTNAETLYGLLPLPNIAAYSTDGTNFIFADCGSANMSGSSFPSFLPNSYPTSASADSLQTTITSGGQTNTLTLAASAGTAQCAGGGCTILYDAGQALQAADTFATANGGMILVPSTNINGFYWYLNSFANLHNDVSIAGAVISTGTIQTNSKIYGNIASSKNGQTYPQFGLESLTTVACQNVNPCIATTGTLIAGISLNPAANSVGVVDTNPNTTLVEHSSFLGNGQLGIGYARVSPQTGSCSFGTHMNSVTLTSVAGANTPQVPVYMDKNDNGEKFYDVSASKRGFWWAPCPNGWASIIFDHRADFQGPVMPMFTLAPYGGTIGGYVKLLNTTQDTSSQIVLANLGYPSAFTGEIWLDGAGGISVSGRPIGTIETVNIPTSNCNVSQITNASCRNGSTTVNGTALDYYNRALSMSGYNSTVSIGNNYTTGTAGSHFVSLQLPTAYDNFNRTNGVLTGGTGTGACTTWSSAGGNTGTITNNTVTATNNVTTRLSCSSFPPNPVFAGQFSEATITGFNGTDTEGVSVLGSPGGSFFGTGIDCTEGNGHLYIDQCASGNGCSSGGGLASTTLSPAIGDIIRLEALPGSPSYNQTTLACTSTSPTGVVTTLNYTNTNNNGFDNTLGWPGFRINATGAGDTLDNWNGGFLHPDAQLDVEQDWTQPQHFLKSVTIGPTNPIAGTLASNTLYSSLYATQTNCSSSAAPAVCGSSAAGSVVIAAGATTVTVNTTAVTANSQIFVMEDDSLGTKLGVTCNTTILASPPEVTARTAATSFQITTSTAPTTNPACYSYFIVN